MPQQVRRLAQAEYPAATALVKAVFDAYVAGDYGREGIGAFYEFLREVGASDPAAPEAHALWGAFIEGELAGVLCAKATRDHINLLFVDPRYHRRGLAAELLGTLREEAAARGNPAITVNASRYGLPAYARMGFCPAAAGEQLRDGIRFTPMTYYLNGYLLRPWRAEDATPLSVYANDELVAANLRNAFPHPYAESDARAYIGDCLRDQAHQLCLCIEAEGQPAGSIGVFPLGDVYEKSAEIGYWLGRPFWGRGIMTKAVKEICEMAFSRWDIVRIHAEVFSENPASCRVLEKAGFACEGVKRSSVYKNGRLMDSRVYAFIRQRNS